MHLPRLMLAAPASGSGKTMITCGLLQAFLERGLDPSAFKCGPDFIDPMFHRKIIGAPSRNLDPFFTDEETTRYLFASHAKEKGISVMEGVMGYFDGIGGSHIQASSYDLACMTDTPVILILNARGMSLSAVPWIQGFVEYEKKLGSRKIQGGILNQAAAMTYQMLKPLIEKETGIKVCGYVPKLQDCQVESRHLGLVTPEEVKGLKERLSRLAHVLEETLDMEQILSIAEEAPDYGEEEWKMPEAARKALGESKTLGLHPKIAVARDEAFCFYYADNLELLERMGAELVEFSPLKDGKLPEGISGLLLGGGYPELYLKGLSENVEMRLQIRRALQKGLPCLAECGGFMYLHEKMEDLEGGEYPVAGALQGKAFYTGRLSRFGYIALEPEPGREPQLLSQGEQIRAHEFHYFDSENPGEDYCAQKPLSKRNWKCVHGNQRSALGYPHLYYWSNPAFALKFLRAADAFGCL